MQQPTVDGLTLPAGGRLMPPECFHNIVPALEDDLARFEAAVQVLAGRLNVGRSQQLLHLALHEAVGRIHHMLHEALHAQARRYRLVHRKSPCHMWLFCKFWQSLPLDSINRIARGWHVPLAFPLLLLRRRRRILLPPLGLLLLLLLPLLLLLLLLWRRGRLLKPLGRRRWHPPGERRNFHRCPEVSKGVKLLCPETVDAG